MTSPDPVSLSRIDSLCQIALRIPQRIEFCRLRGDDRAARHLLGELRDTIAKLKSAGLSQYSEFWQALENRAIFHGVEIGQDITR